jgi:hypothetical protein
MEAMQQAWEVTTKGTNTMTNAHDPTFPNIGDHAGPMPGLTAIEHAALVTGQPCSGTPWLDDMIRAQRRERLAGQASEQDIRHYQDFKQYTTMYGTPDGSPVPKYSREQARYRYADALIAALEGDKE